MRKELMKKTGILLLVGCLMTGIFSGCGKSEAENVQQSQEASENAALVNARIEGSFTVTVKELLPDYVLDDFTMSCAVVTPFQDVPFIVYIGPTASVLEVGKQYTFTILSKPIGAVEVEEIGREISYLEAYGSYGRVEIASFREATEDEKGLGGKNIQIVEDK